ncbi:MCE family protein [Mycobacterium avium]|uniref:MCE family protein n=1 Tax=Mycobacterium avium TaxID=1764 RepID=UPI001CC73A89|nr:MCE family protein [Mycobacterium avium]MBZ4522657.1 MCE family protein [Mycobacterium avium subsp. hominissuis]MBZ4533059.1 MCE family protein [Mycobacterium avium subsp. hominissuis]
MRALEPANRLRTGALAILLVVVGLGVGQSFTSVPMLFASPPYYGQFSDSGGLSVGDKVRILGTDVGDVQEIAIEGNHVVIRFSLGTHTIGTESRLAIKTETILGKKVLEIQPRGSKVLRPNGVLPVAQSTTPYQIYDAFFDVTKATAGWDTDTVKQSLNVLSQTIVQTHPHLSAALDGVAKFSDTLGKRDEEIEHLLAQAKQVAGVVGDRSEQINTLLVNAKSLLAAFNRRGQAIEALLGNIVRVSTQVRGLISDSPNLHHVLDQLNIITDLLVKHRDDLASVLTTIRNYTAALNEAVSSGPYFKVLIANLLPGQMLQPFVDAAFKKRGIDPEQFWRSAGLPAFKFPDPNGARFSNGAPPPAPPVLEGTPDHPGPAVPPGSPCSYTPGAEGIPRPDNPLPCVGATIGPFGGLDFPVPLNVATSPANPAGPPPMPGIPSAGRPGQPVPDAPGTPVPLAPALPGARTGPVGPALTPPPVMVPPSAATPPPTPGPQLPAPFVMPDVPEGGSR